MRLCDIKRRKPFRFDEAKKVLEAASEKVDRQPGWACYTWNGIHAVLKEDLHVFKQANFFEKGERWDYGRCSTQVIVNLIVPKRSKVYLGPAHSPSSQLVCYKARASQALVHSIYDFDGQEKEIAYSIYDRLQTYKPGKIKRPAQPFDMDFRECASGIHFFLDIGSALNYCN